MSARHHSGSGNSDKLSRFHREDVFGAVLAAIGREATFRLIEAFGGTRLYVAKVPRQGNRIATEIGPEAACQLAAVFGSDTIALPLATAWRIQVYRARAWSYPKIARAIGVSEATVARQLKAMGLTNPAARPVVPAASNAATPAPLAPMLMPAIRRGSGPELPLFPRAASETERGTVYV